MNIFRNDIDNLIQTVLIARKENGQSVFSYQNFNKVFTQGIETELSVSFLNNFTLAGGYQYLEAKDKDVLDRIKAGQLGGNNDRGNYIILYPEITMVFREEVNILSMLSYFMRTKWLVLQCKRNL